MAIADNERVGREIFSRRFARIGRAGGVNYRNFMGEESAALSVDLLDRAPLKVMTQIGDKNAVNRGTGRSFYGWAVVCKADAEQDGRTVLESPTLWNPFHADIGLPPLGDDEMERLDSRRLHAQSLAAAAHLLAPVGRPLP